MTEADVVTEVVQVVEPVTLEEGEIEEIESAPRMERSQSASDSGIGSEPDSAGEEEKMAAKKEKKNIKAASVTAPPRPPRREGLRSRK